MADDVTPQELERLLHQLQRQDLEAIGRQLGLNLHSSVSTHTLPESLQKDPELRKRAKQLALSLDTRVQCSFCGERASDQRKMVTSPKGATVCSVCLRGFTSAKP